MPQERNNRCEGRECIFLLIQSPYSHKQKPKIEDRLLQTGKNKTEKINEKRKIKELAESQQCSFKPKLNQQ
jgi:hypothetical protein